MTTATGPHVTSSPRDLESGQGAQVAPLAAVGGSGDSALPPREAQLAASQAEIPDEIPSSACRCIPSGVFRPFTSTPGGSNIDRSQRNVGDQSIQTEQDPSQAEAQIHPPHEEEPEDPHVIGDFDGSSNTLWTLFKDETMNYDDAQIDTLKSDMKNSLLFAGLFSATLTPFLVDSKQNLKPSPADETVYYLRQHSTILSQISVQLSSIAPQVSIPSTPPPPFPVPNTSASAVRVNVFWFMALVFSLLAAFLAILVQRWGRNYRRVFQRYGDPLKSSRLRQYLYEGREEWYMPMVAEAVPGFLNISLFLFFAGLADSLLNINTRVALSTIVPIGISSLLYIFMMLSPIIYPQSPYQNLLSGIFWHFFQTLRGRRFKDSGETKPVSTNMAQGRMQLAMEETHARKGRDVRAIRWLFDNLTEDAEMEKVVSALPGLFNTEWGMEVWMGVQSQDGSVARPHRDTEARRFLSSWSIRNVLRPIIRLFRQHTHDDPTAHTRGEDVVRELSIRVAHSVEECKNRSLFLNDYSWRRRSRACIEATASLVCCANAKPAWFGDISELLGEMGRFENTRELSLAGTDKLFVRRWTCLSLVLIRSIWDNWNVWFWAGQTMERLAVFAEEDDTGKKDEVAGAQKIDETLKKASHYLFRLRDALSEKEDVTEEVKEILRGHESQISELEQINTEADRTAGQDHAILSLQNAINTSSRQIISQFPAISILDDFDGALIPFSRLVELSRDPRKMLFIRPTQILKSMCSSALTLRNILDGQGDADAYKEMLKNLQIFYSSSRWKGNEIQRQLWRLQDLRDGDGLGFTVELFFFALSRLLSTYPSKESNSALYTGTFRAITSDWRRRKSSLGTQRLLLDIAISRGEEFDFRYPADTADEFLLLLRNILEGQTGTHIDEAIQELTSNLPLEGGKFDDRLLNLITDSLSTALPRTL